MAALCEAPETWILDTGELDCMRSLWQYGLPGNLRTHSQVNGSQVNGRDQMRVKIGEGRSCRLSYMLASHNNEKNNEACGPYTIRMEMLKNTSPELHKSLLKLFNMFYFSGWLLS